MWNKSFLQQLLKLGFPIMLQNLFTVLGATITTLMTGQLGDVPLAAIGLANQLFFILSLVQFGISSGAAIFTAQFWGNNDKDGISKVLGVSLLVDLSVSAMFMAIALFFPGEFLHLFTSDKQVIELGVSVLRIVGFSYLFTPITFTYNAILRSTGNVRLPMVVSSIGILLNIVFGYLLIFGKLGMPALGAQGAAYANLIARVVECAVMVGLTYYLKTPLAVYPRQMFSFNTSFLSKILKRVLPVTINELMWSLGISAYSAIYAHISTEAIAAINIRASIEDMFFAPFLGITHACAIVVGNAIGSGEQEKSHGYIKQTVRIVLVMGICLGAVLILGRGFIASLYNISDLTNFYTRNLLLVLGAFLWLRTINTLYFIAMLRSGGDTHFGSWVDVGCMWLIGVPAALVTAFVFHLPVYLVYLAIMLDEATKLVLFINRYRSRKWIHNLVERA
jgi:putative MATE family efflux protein